MKSRFFTDTQGLDASPPPRDQVCVCLLMNRGAYEQAVRRAAQLNITSGEYIARLILNASFSACGTKGLQRQDSPWPCFPPAPPDH